MTCFIMFLVDDSLARILPYAIYYPGVGINQLPNLMIYDLFIQSGNFPSHEEKSANKVRIHFIQVQMFLHGSGELRESMPWSIQWYSSIYMISYICTYSNRYSMFPHICR